MDKTKTIATAVLVLIAVALAFVLFTSAPEDKPADAEIFLMSLNATQQVFIIMDLRGALNETVRNNIMQCGADFAGSEGLVGKNITAFALEGEKCTTMQGTVGIDNCIKQSKAGVSIIVTGTKATTYYKNKAEILVGPVYSAGECRINKQYFN